MKAVLCVLAALSLVAVAYADPVWTTVGSGVTILNGGSPCRIALAFGGFGYTQGDSQSWVTHVAAAAGFASKYGIKDLIAIKGPADAGYKAREIGNSKILAYLKGLANGQCSATGSDPLTLLAFDHSSGGFVAAEWMSQMYSQLPTVLARTILYDLDGGSPPAAAAKKLLWFFPVSTIKNDGTLQAMNYGSVHNLCNGLGLASTKCRFINVRDADLSGCLTANPKQKGVGNWCLHMFTVNQRPHSQSLSGGVYRQDLTDVNANHPIQIDWIVQTQTEVAALFALSSAPPHPAPRAASRIRKLHRKN